MSGSTKTQHGQQWYLNPIPNWKLYENPFFTMGPFVPEYIPRHFNAFPCRSTKSFFVREAQFTSIGSEFSLAPDSCAKLPNAVKAAPTHSAPPPLQLHLDRNKYMSGSLVSARKLAASFWEQQSVQTLKKPNRDRQSSQAQAQHPYLAAPPTFGGPSSPSYCKLFEVLEEIRETTEGACESINMASNQTAILANVLHRIRSVEESQSRSLVALHNLKLDVEDVASRAQELEFSQESALKEVNSSLQKFGEQLAISRRREQEKLKLAFLHLSQEMEEERNACRLLKVQNNKLAKDLTNANITTADACEELERERKARELLEELCNELAREIGEDKAEVEQLKQEQEKSRERLEEELKMMRMVALWQDEGGSENDPEAKNEEGVSMAPLVNGAACSNVCCGNQETISSMTGIMLDSDTGNHSYEKSKANLSGEGQRGSMKTRRPRKSRRPTSTGGQQRHKGGLINWKNPHFWENGGNSAWASSENELFQRQLITTCQNHTSQVGRKDVNNHDERAHVNSDVVCSKELLLGGRQSELASSSDGVTAKESTLSKQGLHSELDHNCLEPVKGACKAITAHDKLSHEITGDEGSGANTARIVRGISDRSDEASNCGIMVKCTQGCTDAKKENENFEHTTFSTNLETKKINNVEGRTDSGDHEALKKMSPWRPTSAKLFPRLWPPSPDAFSVFGGAMKRSIKACSLSPPSVQDEQRQYRSKIIGLHTRSHTMEGSMAEEASDQQPRGSIKDNSLGAQLIKARELEKEMKPAKSSFRFSPLRRAVSYG